MPATGQNLLAELRDYGFTVTREGAQIMLEPASKLTDAQRKAIKGARRSVLLALALETIEARVWDPADGPDPDGMFERWQEHGQ
jgi:hypothetical protein